ncbi:MAG: class I SAM-dependent methyltransferase, partial [Bdellovibrionota bacterium]
MTFRDYFSTQATDYARFRPRYPRALFQHLSEACANHDLAWDCGTGNGQAAVALAPFFKRVVATDPSENQLAEADRSMANVHYSRAQAEESCLEAASADLITVAQAFHWFDQPRFFREVERVSKPGGLLAVWCYELCNITPAVDAVVMELYRDILGPYWDKGRKLVEEGYRNEKFPFTEIEAPRATMGLSWNVADLIGYLGTWSALAKYRREKGSDPRELMIPRLQRAWGDLSKEKTVTWPLPVR